MKNILLLFLFLTIHLFSFSQNFSWAKSMGGNGDDYGYATAIDAAGNVYTAGYFEGTSDFNPGTGIYDLSAIGPSDFFISKLNAKGEFVWAKRFGGNGYEEVKALVVDDKGHLFATGSFRDTVDFDPDNGVYNLQSSTGTPLNDDIFVLALDTAGKFIWAKQMGGQKPDAGSAITYDQAGNIYTTGMFSGTADFNPGVGVFNLVSTPNNPSMYISKLDASGNFKWAVVMAYNAQFAQGLAIAADAAQNLYTTGYYWGSGDFNPGNGNFILTSTGLDDIFISKLDSSGSFIWAKNIGGSNSEQGMAMTLDPKSNIYITGYFGGACDFDPSASVYDLNSNGLEDVFVAKYDSAGSLLWAKGVGGNKNERAYAICLDGLLQPCVTGGYAGIADFDPGANNYSLTAYGVSDVYILKLDSLGRFLWVADIGGPDFARGQGIAMDAGGTVYCSGYYGGTADFDPGNGKYNMTVEGIHDVFVMKLCAPPGKTGSISGTLSVCEDGVGVYTLPSVFGASDYNWIVSSGVTILSGQNTNSITVKFGKNSGTIKVMPFNACSNGASDSIMVTVNAKPVFVNQPSNQTVVKGGTVKFNVKVVGTNTIYQWQQDSGTGFFNLTNGSFFQGVDRDTLVIQAATLNMNGRQFRCLIHDLTCNDTSAIVKLNVNSTGIPSNEAFMILTVTPNPVKNNLLVTNETGHQDETFEVMDITGRIVLIGTIGKPLDCTNLPSGYYILQCREARVRFVKE